VRLEQVLQAKKEDEISQRADNEMLKQLREDNARLQMMISQKSNEMDELRMGQISQQFQSCFWRFDEALQGIEKDLQMGRDVDGLDLIGENKSPNFGGPLVNQEMRAQIESLQK